LAVISMRFSLKTNFTELDFSEDRRESC
jgi:hypothetical protein